jgi:tRNA(adenine34) deaminase
MITKHAALCRAAPWDRPVDSAPHERERALGFDDVDFHAAMGAALEEATTALHNGDVPVGAVALRGGVMVARGHNERETDRDPTAHAEMAVLREAARREGSWHLDDVTVVVTLEPCPMCAGALVAARTRRVVFGATDPKAGACGSLYNICADPRLNHEVEVVGGVRAEECGRLLTAFFAERRPS